jgi:hypothetical protein
MPVLIPLALNIGFYIEYLIKSFKDLKDKRETIPVYFNFGLIAAIGILFPITGFFLGPFLKGSVLFWFLLSALILLLIGLLILQNLKRKSFKKIIYLSVGMVIAICLCVLPISRIQFPSNHKSITALNKDVQVYYLDYVSPEMIWLYGNKIERYDESSEIKESTFGLLINDISKEDKKKLETNYILEFHNTFDLNKVETSSSKYRSRLKNDFYILTKKFN